MADWLSAELQEVQLHYWHIDYFRALGFDRHQAEILELAKIQPHDLEDLLDAGCPREIELLVEILA